MVKYFKITGINDIQNDLSYVGGPNTKIADDIYFTTIEYIPKYYYLGTILREIIIPDDSNFQIINFDDKFRTDKIILGEKYCLFEPETYQRFDLNMEYNIHLINTASANGDINFLIKWEKNNWNLKYSSDAMDLASENGHIDVLEWWKNSGFKLKYTECAFNWANECGQISVLDWWSNNNFEIKCSPKSILAAVKNGHNHIADWWKRYNSAYLNIVLSDNKIINQKCVDNQIIDIYKFLKPNIIILIGSLIIFIIAFFN
jgi:hypothetical protein